MELIPLAINSCVWSCIRLMVGLIRVKCFQRKQLGTDSKHFYLFLLVGQLTRLFQEEQHLYSFLLKVLKMGQCKCLLFCYDPF